MAYRSIMPYSGQIRLALSTISSLASMADSPASAYNMPIRDSTRPKSLIVVGAGVAGVKLAHSCLERDPDMEITILEANDYIGGRVRSFEFEGHTVEMGANWISGRTEAYDNPTWRLAQEVGLDGHATDRDDARAVLATDGRGRDVTAEYVESKKRFDDVYERAVRLCVERGITPRNDANVRSVLEECGWKEEELSAVDRAVEFNVLEVWVVDGLERLGAAHDMQEGANDVDLGQDEFFVEDRRGFNSILGGMVRDLERWGTVIKLNAEVRRVQYLPGDVRVVASDLITGDLNEYVADAVVSTVSLGVLQSGAIEFSPAFPDWKTKALKEIGMFVFAKVFAKFEEKFWPNKDQLIICGERKGHYPLWMKYRNVDQHLFMCYLGGSEARRVESLTTEQIKDEVEELFRNAYQNNLMKSHDPKIFRPSSVAVTNWSRNPRFCGSYSYFPVNAFAVIPDSDLTRGLSGREGQQDPITLYFAGECFDDKFNGWVQGAYRSGERVVKSIMGIDKN